MALKAKAPESVIASKPKFMISGESGVGKTFFALDFPRPYLIDTESGATRPQYQEKLKKSNGAYFGKDEGSQDFSTIIQEIEQLATTKHDYKTLIIDSFSYLYLLKAAEAELEGGSDFGRDKKEANKPTRQMMRWLEKLDMSVILICHSKDKWERKGKEIINLGSTFDGFDKLEYILDLWVEILKGGKTFMVRKSRIASLPQGNSYPVDYQKFAELYGKDIIEKEVIPIELASSGQVDRVKELTEALKVDADTIEKWFKKCDVESWEEMSQKQILSCMDYCENKIKALTTTKEEPKKGKK